jgi:hypothetical protein
MYSLLRSIVLISSCAQVLTFSEIILVCRQVDSCRSGERSGFNHQYHHCIYHITITTVDIIIIYLTLITIIIIINPCHHRKHNRTRTVKAIKKCPIYYNNDHALRHPHHCNFYNYHKLIFALIIKTFFYLVYDVHQSSFHNHIYQQQSPTTFVFLQKLVKTG